MIAEDAYFAGWQARKRLTYELVMGVPCLGYSPMRKTLDKLLE